jgi:hypothetical protein
MLNELTPITQAEQALVKASTPYESKQVEVIAATAKAWAKEQGDFENVIEAARIYILARRKTTELIEPNIRQGQHGREGNDSVTFLEDYGFTKMQWQRRKKEIENITIDDVESYIDDCIEKHSEPTSYGLIRYMSDDPHVSFNTGENEWYTPEKYVESARLVMGSIDTDPASSELANKTVKANKYFTEETNGLNQKWEGNVWMNPPYAQPLISDFSNCLIEKYNAGEFNQACVLVNNATETQFYQVLMKCCSAICFIKGRIKFIDENGNATGAPLQGQTIIYYGSNLKQFVDEFSKYGQVLYAR